MKNLRDQYSLFHFLEFEVKRPRQSSLLSSITKFTRIIEIARVAGTGFIFFFSFFKANGERRLHLRLYGYIRWRIHSLRYLGPKLWNSLPSNLRNLPSQPFKRQIRLVNLSLKLKSDWENCVCSNWHKDWPNCFIHLFFYVITIFFFYWTF